jgi:putative hydrolase of the HAD superfamily
VLRPNGVETIKKLSQMGIKLGIISNTDSMNFVNKRLFNFGLLKYFDQNCIFLSALSGLRKPDPVLFKAACTDIGVKLSEACYVGDTIDKDVEGARKAGYKLQIRIIANNDSVGQGKEAKYVIKNLKEIVDIIKRENKK